MHHNFLQFLKQLKNSSNESLLEYVELGFKACFEAHRGLYRHLDEIVNNLDLEAKNWPEDIKKEIYEEIDHTIFGREGMHLGEQFEKFKDPKVLKELNDLNVKYEPAKVLTLTKDSFTDSTQKRLGDRITQQDIVGFPHDKKRHDAQREILEKSDGINPKPVMLIELNGKYELQEGWHRTTQVILYNMKRKSNSFKLNAYVGHPPPKEGPESTSTKIKKYLIGAFKKLKRG